MKKTTKTINIKEQLLAIMVETNTTCSIDPLIEILEKEFQDRDDRHAALLLEVQGLKTTIETAVEDFKKNKTFSERIWSGHEGGKHKKINLSSGKKWTDYDELVIHVKSGRDTGHSFSKTISVKEELQSNSTIKMRLSTTSDWVEIKLNSNEPTKFELFDEHWGRVYGITGIKYGQ